MATIPVMLAHRKLHPQYRIVRKHGGVWFIRLGRVRLQVCLTK